MDICQFRTAERQELAGAGPPQATYPCFLMLVDGWSQYITLYLVPKDPSAQHLTNILIQYFSQVSAPWAASTDNASNFQSILSQVLATLNVTQFRISPLNSRANFSERKNKAVLRLLRLIYQEFSPSPNVLALAVYTSTFVLNTQSYKALSHLSPFQLFYGRAPTQDMARPTRHIASTHPYPEYLKAVSRVQQIWFCAVNDLKRKKEGASRRPAAGQPPPVQPQVGGQVTRDTTTDMNFLPGDFVLIRAQKDATKLNHKLLPNYNPVPHRIIEITGAPSAQNYLCLPMAGPYAQDLGLKRFPPVPANLLVKVKGTRLKRIASPLPHTDQSLAQRLTLLLHEVVSLEGPPPTQFDQCHSPVPLFVARNKEVQALVRATLRHPRQSVPLSSPLGQEIAASLGGLPVLQQPHQSSGPPFLPFLASTHLTKDSEFSLSVRHSPTRIAFEKHFEVPAASVRGSEEVVLLRGPPRPEQVQGGRRGVRGAVTLPPLLPPSPPLPLPRQNSLRASSSSDSQGMQTASSGSSSRIRIQSATVSGLSTRSTMELEWDNFGEYEALGPVDEEEEAAVLPGPAEAGHPVLQPPHQPPTLPLLALPGAQATAAELQYNRLIDYHVPQVPAALQQQPQHVPPAAHHDLPTAHQQAGVLPAVQQEPPSHAAAAPIPLPVQQAAPLPPPRPLEDRSLPQQQQLPLIEGGGPDPLAVPQPGLQQEVDPPVVLEGAAPVPAAPPPAPSRPRTRPPPPPATRHSSRRRGLPP